MTESFRGSALGAKLKRGASPPPDLPVRPKPLPPRPREGDTLTESLSPSHVTLELGGCHGQAREPLLCHSHVVKTCHGNLARDSHTKRVRRSLWVLITRTGVGFCPSSFVGGTSAGASGGGHVFLSAPRSSRVAPWARATSAEGGLRGRPASPPPRLPVLFCGGEVSVTLCLLWPSLETCKPLLANNAEVLVVEWTLSQACCGSMRLVSN